MFFFSPVHGLVKHIFIDISWIMVGNYHNKKKEKKVMLDKKMGKVAKGEKNKKKQREKRKNRKEKCFIVFLKFYVNEA